MKIQRTKNATRNIVFGILYKIITILLPFVIRTVMIYIMGSEYVGLNSLFTSILSFLNLAELGVGSALVYSMYKPIAEDDKDGICALLNLYRTLYRIIGAIILVSGFILLPFLKYLVKGECPDDVNLYILYLIYVFNTVLSYWLFAYKQSLLMAFQRTDIISKRSMIIQLTTYVFQVGVLFFFHNYYLYIILMPIATIFTNIINSLIVDKMYPEYKCAGKVPKEITRGIKKKIIALFGTKANSIVMHAADNIVISSFLGLSIVGQYGNYYYILNSIVGIMTIIYNSLTAGIGNSLETESLDKNYMDFKILSFLNSWIVMFCSVSLLCVYQNFMLLWVHEELMFTTDVVVLLVIYFYVYQIRRIVLTYKDASGLWWEDRLRPYGVMIANLVGNLVLVQFIGIYGVIISTILSMFVSLPWENRTLFTFLFKRSSKEYYIMLIKYTGVTALCAAVTWFACTWVPKNIVGLFVRCIVCLILPNIIFIGIYYRSGLFQSSLEIMKSKVLKKAKK